MGSAERRRILHYQGVVELHLIQFIFPYSRIHQVMFTPPLGSPPPVVQPARKSHSLLESRQVNAVALFFSDRNLSHLQTSFALK